MFFICGLSFYLGEISLAGLVRCDMADVGQTNSGTSHELRSCLLPLVLLGNDVCSFDGMTAYFMTAVRLTIRYASSGKKVRKQGYLLIS